MTEAQWRKCCDSRLMVEFLGENASPRKMRLVACAGCRRIWHLLDKANKQAVLVAERFADGLATDRERRRALRLALRHLPGYWTLIENITELADSALVLAGRVAIESQFKDADSDCDAQKTEAYYDNEDSNSDLFRDVFGPLLFRPVTVGPAWLTWNHATVPAIARHIYDDRAFHDLPILADALEDAGCTDPDILAHCRQGGEHVRGCWVVDLILGKT